MHHPSPAPVRLRSTRFASLLCLVLLLGTAMPAGAQEVTPVNVRLLERSHPQSVLLLAQDGPVPIFAGPGDNPIGQLEAGEQATVSVRSGELYVELLAGALHARSIQLVPEAGAAVRVERLNGLALPDPRSYEGRLAIDLDPLSPTELRLINRLDLESYVTGVVAREYGFDDVEGAKAMAVAARTYALRNIGRFGADYDHVDYSRSQAFAGSGAHTETARTAVRETAGEVLTHDGELIEAVHFASSGGHTADNETVWDGAPLPYLRGKPDPYDEGSPHGRWRNTVSRTELLDALGAAYGMSLEGFQVADRSADGRIQAVTLLGTGGENKTIQSNAFRLIVNQQFGDETLKSTLFDVQRDGGQYVFEGRGYGHGVGLNQWGVHTMAEAGHDYRDILGFYYTGVTLEPYGGGVAQPLTAAASTAPRTERQIEPSPATTQEAPDSDFAQTPSSQQADGSQETPLAPDTVVDEPIATQAEEAPRRSPSAASAEEIPTWNAIPPTPEPAAGKRRIGW